MSQRNDRTTSMTAPGMEAALLSCVMQAPDEVMPRLNGVVDLEDFTAGSFHRDLFAIINARYSAGKLCDLMSLTQAMLDAGSLTDAVGGSGRLVEIYTQAEIPSRGPMYAREIRQKAIQRRMTQAADLFLHRMTDDCAGWSDHSVALVDALIEQQRGSEERATIVPIKTAVFEAMDELELAVQNRGHVTSGLATGFTALDRCFMGLRPTQNMVIAGRPAMGKTALAVNILENISLGEGHYREFYSDPSEWPGCRQPRQGKPPTLLVCLESSQVEMASRMLCGRAQVSVQRIRDGLMGKDDFRRIGQSAQDIGTSPIYIWDAAGITVEELELELKSFKQRVPDLAAVAVDHCGLLRAKGVKDAGNDYARTGYVSNRLRLLWKTLGVLGIPLWQLSREVEKRADKRPKLADLRDSGKIEEDATQVIMPFRPAYYDEEAPADEAFIVIAKNRGGPTSAEGVKVKWTAEFTRFDSLQSHLFSNNEDQRQHNF